VSSFAAPSPALVRLGLAIPRLYFHPQFFGLEQLDLTRPALWVGNHTLYGLADVPFLFEHLYVKHGVVLRALGDRGHLAIPGWGRLLERVGMVVGTRENCARLMRRGEHVLVFPGGIREVTRRRGEAYRLLWKERVGFARLAIEHGYDIIPFGAVGADDMFEYIADANDLLGSPVWQAVAKLLPLERWTRGGDVVPPLVHGLGPTIVPRPQRFYFGVGARIPTTLDAGADADARVWALRNEVAQAIERQLAGLLELRARDLRNWSALRRWLAPLPRGGR
jgi:1-acyl-sn-glycerol-3-phosphate acyltransferase